ncbi:MAG: hypothetical protein H0V97_11025 [Actinobacteria bacterium]|nr:hypothetical protein [Actinomycetota bacterium]
MLSRQPPELQRSALAQPQLSKRRLTVKRNVCMREELVALAMKERIDRVGWHRFIAEALGVVQEISLPLCQAKGHRSPPGRRIIVV